MAKTGNGVQGVKASKASKASKGAAAPDRATMQRAASIAARSAAVRLWMLLDGKASADLTIAKAVASTVKLDTAAMRKAIGKGGPLDERKAVAGVVEHIIGTEHGVAVAAIPAVRSILEDCRLVLASGDRMPASVYGSDFPVWQAAADVLRLEVSRSIQTLNRVAAVKAGRGSDAELLA